MSAIPLSDDKIKQALKAYDDALAEGYSPLGSGKAGRSAFRRAAEVLASKEDLTVNGAMARIRNALNRKEPEPEPVTPSIIHPTIADEDDPIEVIIDRTMKATRRKREARQSKDWREIRIRGKGPIGIASLGDPHMDNDGCNWDLLKRDIDLIKSTEGMFAANVGDSVDNWVGRLIKHKGNSSTTDSTAWRMVEWLLNELDGKWVYWLLGNHDTWNDGLEIFKRIVPQVVPMDDWQARFVLVFDNGFRLPVWAAHNFKGHSQYNKAHGAEKADLWSRGAARLYISGHTHEWTCVEEECPERKITYWKTKARGYKYVDSYAENLQYFSQESGASITAVIDPDAKHEAQVLRCFPDIEEAADFLTWKRSR